MTTPSVAEAVAGLHQLLRPVLASAGVAVTRAPGEPDALEELTPQRRQIVCLASDGLTDREIADRLFLTAHGQPAAVPVLSQAGGSQPPPAT
jgi:DNA-binding NarL/FixJ family response regulator